MMSSFSKFLQFEKVELRMGTVETSLPGLKHKSLSGKAGKALLCRGEKTRTSDPLHPMQVR